MGNEESEGRKSPSLDMGQSPGPGAELPVQGQSLGPGAELPVQGQSLVPGAEPRSRGSGACLQKLTTFSQKYINIYFVY